MRRSSGATDVNTTAAAAVGTVAGVPDGKRGAKARGGTYGRRGRGASPRRGWRRRFPNHLVGRRPHLRTRSCEYTHTRSRKAPNCTQDSRRPIPRCNTNAYVSSRRATYPEINQIDGASTAPRNTVPACCGCDHRSQPFAFCGGTPVVRHAPPCSGYHPLGSSGVVEP